MRILVVEDETKLAELIRRTLQRDGFDVEVTRDARDATRWLHTSVCDLMVLDASLPDGDGLTLCRDVRANGHPVPILLLSTRRRVADRVNGLDAGADDYLTKPFVQRELSARARALIRRTGGPGLHRIAVGDLLLDPLTREVRRARRQIELTQKEFSLLEYLMRRANRPVSRSMIAEHVWGVLWDRRTNVIDVFVSHLRRKLDLPTEPSLLHAVRGVGYIIRPPGGSGFAQFPSPDRAPILPAGDPDS